MEQSRTGWVVMTPKHSASQKGWIVESTFSSTRSEAIKTFIAGTSLTWRQWKAKYNYVCVKATMTVKCD